MDLANLGKSGLMVAQNRLQTAAHNINNVDTPGYSRQQVLVQTAGAQATAGGWLGRGAMTVGVQRAYDHFLDQQLMQARTKSAAFTTYQDQISQVNNLIADRTVGISPALQKFFDGLQAVATAPADVAAREELLGRANSLASQVRDADAFLDDLRKHVNTQVDAMVSQVNSYLERIRDMNQQVLAARATAPGQPPNDLLDQRGQLLASLGELISVTAFEQDGVVSLTVGNGQVVLANDTVFPLAARPASDDPGRWVVVAAPRGDADAATAVEMDASAIAAGSLGGLLAFRAEVLDTVQADLGRLAAGLAETMNAQHAAGFDLSGNPGEPFFGLGASSVIPGRDNAYPGGPSVGFGDVSKLTGDDYRVAHDGTQFVVSRVSDRAVVASGNGLLSFDGLVMDTTGLSADQGDHWTVQSTRGLAASLTVDLGDPARIAAAGPSAAGDGTAAGSANGDNALALAELQTRKLLGGSTGSPAGQGTMGLNEAYARIVNNIAVKAQHNETAKLAQDALVQQNLAAQQAVSGVNLDEEYIQLQRFQEQYRAAARLIDTASILFDTLLGLRA